MDEYEAKVAFSQKLADFALNLFHKCENDKKNSNAFLSPTSIAMALAMTYAGADGRTKKQMQEVMFPGLDDKIIYENLEALAKVLNPEKQDGMVLNLANRLYCEKSFEISQNYKNQLQKDLHADILNVDFQGHAGQVTKEINKWVEDVTNKKIQNLLDDLQSTVKLVLVNAIYFKGDWAKPFEESATTIQDDFHVSENQTKKVDMMHAEHKKFHFFEDEKHSLLGIPYVNGDLMMVFVLPKERYGLDKIEKSMTGENLLNMINRSFATKVEVALPKFKLEQKLDLIEYLSALGISDLFTSQADLSKISSTRLCIDKAVHKAYIEVNEKGSEAAAATAMVAVRCCMIVEPPEVKKFTADHPFLFAIVDIMSNAILFLGHFYG